MLILFSPLQGEPGESGEPGLPGEVGLPVSTLRGGSCSDEEELFFSGVPRGAGSRGDREAWTWTGLQGLNQPRPWFGYWVTHRHVTGYL